MKLLSTSDDWTPQVGLARGLLGGALLALVLLALVAVLMWSLAPLLPPTAPRWDPGARGRALVLFAGIGAGLSLAIYFAASAVGGMESKWFAALGFVASCALAVLLTWGSLRSDSWSIGSTPPIVGAGAFVGLPTVVGAGASLAIQLGRRKRY